MDFKIFLTAFSAVFLAELADKTQIVGIGLAAKTGKPWQVWVGSVAAYMVVTLISVFIGSLLSKYLRPELIRYCGASIFIVIGVLILLKLV
jgi:putative Ca2+/H+ antiporter (TMEM165/GDT1 family)